MTNVVKSAALKFEGNGINVIVGHTFSDGDVSLTFMLSDQDFRVHFKDRDFGDFVELLIALQADRASKP